MFLCGTVKVSGPDFEKREVDFKSKISGEFHLEMKKGTVPKIEDFGIWVEMVDDTEISIETSIADGMGIEDFLQLIIKGKKGENVALMVSPKQALALGLILERYATVHRGFQMLTREEKVDIV